jgi:hypothetical protein
MAKCALCNGLRSRLNNVKQSFYFFSPDVLQVLTSMAGFCDGSSPLQIRISPCRDSRNPANDEIHEVLEFSAKLNPWTFAATRWRHL